ncbi:CPBP family intramembrane glutamic endopeptidase [Nonomuraea sp. NPDC050547]|uniref:CPBP family intramembrane glutamic endopeptidase n=1 Tax=unclassified Nonomuraea TaxID=2593643 RepID=UPI0037A881B3
MTDNPLFALATSGKRRTHPILALVVAVAAILLGGLIGAIVLTFTGLPADPALRMLVNLVTGFAPVALLIWLWIGLFEERGFRTLGFTREHAAWRSARGLLTGVLSFGLVTAILVVPGFTLTENVPQGVAAIGPAILVFAGWVVQGSTEEIVTRGFLLPVVGARYGAVVGVGLSSMLFAALHLLNPGVNALSLVNLVLVGVLLGLYALWEGALWGVCLWHAAWNWAQGNVFGFEVSGTGTGMMAIVDLKENGPDVVTGGLFGPEGGVATTLVLALGIAVLSLGLRRASRQARPA